VILKKSKKTKHLIYAIALLYFCNPILAQIQMYPAIKRSASNNIVITKFNYPLHFDKQINNILVSNNFERCNVKKHRAKIPRFQQFSCYLYPNPCQGSLCIEFERLSPSLIIKVTNTAGSTICTIKKPDYINMVHLTRELSSKYIVSIADENHEIIKKITMN